MTTCWACEASLDPAWKYCTQCGVPIEKDADPGMRPDGTVARPPLSPIAVFGWIMAAIGVALLASAIALFFIVRQ